MTLRAPFPWFGGKSFVADQIWARLGDVDNYVEPFAGSLAVLLGRPHEPHVETVNDLNGYIANFWRAVSADAALVEQHANWPVNECDLHARHLWLLDRRSTLTDQLMADPDYCDAKIAGWWVWGVSAWIGSGWCSGYGSWRNVDGAFTKTTADCGVQRQIPCLGTNGNGVHSLRGAQFTALQERLRRVRVVCGDWTRVVGSSVTYNHPSVRCNGICGVVLDPPYDHNIRDTRLYSEDCQSISADVRRWALEHGDNPKMRISLCGYEGEHEMPSSWECVAWKTRGGYANAGDNANAHKERVWFSPHCLRETLQRSLFT